MPQLEYILKGIRKEGAHCHSIKQRRDRQLLTQSSMRQLFEVWKKHLVVRDPKMLWVAACLAFFGFLIVGEFTSPSSNSFDKDIHLSLADVSVDNSAVPKMLFLGLKQSKTDQWHLGVTIVLGKSEKVPLCPLTAMLSYLVVRGRFEGPLFV